MLKRASLIALVLILAVSVMPAMAQTDCPADFSGFAPIRIMPAMMGEVMPGSPNRVRSAPSGAGDILTEMPAGTRFLVLEGRSCSDGIVWLQIEIDNQIGWTAESVEGQYYLQPAEGQVTRLPEVPPIPAEVTTEAAVMFSGGAYQIKSSGMGVLIAAATGTTDMVDLWDIDTGTYYEMVFDGAGNVMYFMENASEDSFVTVNLEGGIGFWDVLFEADGEGLQANVLGDYTIAQATNPDFTHIAVGGCFSEAASAGCTRGIVEVYDMSERALAYSLDHPAAVTAIAFSADSSQIATADTSGNIYLWDAADGAEIATIPLGETEVSDMAYDPVGDLLAVGWCEVYQGDSCQVGSVGLFSRENAKLITSYPMHRGAVTSVAFHPDGIMFASGGEDGVVRVRETLMGGMQATYAPDQFGDIQDVIFFTEFNEIGIAGSDAIGIFALPE